MREKYPQPGDVYQSCLYPGQACEIVAVVEAQVTLRWLGQYAYIPEQRVAVNQFIRDFALAT